DNIRIPTGITDVTSNANASCVMVSGAESYFIIWTASNELRYNRNETLILENSKQQSMR
ncbi:11485_t:CDS:1, partial [Gigaspora rosea]